MTCWLLVSFPPLYQTQLSLSHLPSQQLRWIYDVFSAWDQLYDGCHHRERSGTGWHRGCTPQYPFPARAQLRLPLRCTSWVSLESTSKWTCTVKITIFLTIQSIDMDKEAKKDQCGVVSARWGGGGANIKHSWPNLGAVGNYGQT